MPRVFSGSSCLPQQDPGLGVTGAQRDLRPEPRHHLQDSQQAGAPPGASGEMRPESEAGVNILPEIASQIVKP